jgi:four helix bundle suffix protein
LEDYEDFLRQRNLKLWGKDSPEARAIRGLVYKSNWSYSTYKSYLAQAEKAANTMICLINQVNYLLDRQIAVLKEKFLSQGGWTEQIFHERLRRRENRTNKTYKSNKSD